jgi:hypothetical protein
MRHYFSDEDSYRIHWNCISASSLNDRRMMVAIRAADALRIHHETFRKRREAKPLLTFRIEFPDDWTPPRPLPPGIQISLWPELPPNALELFT